MADIDQVAAATEGKKKMTSTDAVELAILFSMLASNGIKDTDEYRKVLSTTFTRAMDGFGYKVVEK
jgi:hypothetical protein